MAAQNRERSRSPLEMLGYCQPRDSHWHGVARIQSMPSACPNARQLTVSRRHLRYNGQRSRESRQAQTGETRVGSQADSAGSIHATRSTHEKCCSSTEFEAFSSGERVFSVHAWATLGHTFPPCHSPSVFHGRSPLSILFSGCPIVRFSGSSNLTQVVTPPQLRARCERAQLRRREETRPVIPSMRRRVRRRDARPV
jgi:hypothetical protein